MSIALGLVASDITPGDQKHAQSQSFAATSRTIPFSKTNNFRSHKILTKPKTFGQGYRALSIPFSPSYKLQNTSLQFLAWKYQLLPNSENHLRQSMIHPLVMRQFLRRPIPIPTRQTLLTRRGEQERHLRPMVVDRGCRAVFAFRWRAVGGC